MANVKFIRTTKEKWVNRDSYDMNALYFLTDTKEFCRGNQLLSDGARMVESYADLPDFNVAADGILYFTQDTHNAYIMSPTRDSWIQAVYATVTDVTEVPEEVADEVVPTVAAVLNVKKQIATSVKSEVSEEVKAYVDEQIAASGTENIDYGEI